MRLEIRKLLGYGRPILGFADQKSSDAALARERPLGDQIGVAKIRKELFAAFSGRPVAIQSKSLPERER